MLFTWLKFGLAAAAVFWGGKHLTLLSNELAETLGLSKGWVGLAVLAMITSLPEMATSGAAAVMGNADVAIGNLLGSNTFNLTFVGILTLIAQPACLWHLLGYEQVLNGGWLILLTLLVLLGLTVPLAVGGISLVSILILVVSLTGMHKICSYHQQQERKHTHRSEAGKKSLYLRLSLFAGLVLAAGVVVAGSAGEIALATGLSNTFVGSVFAAVVTSLPEATVSYHALQLGEMDMAIGNLLGSNLINTTLLLPAELLYSEGSIFAAASAAHLFTCLILLLLTGIVLFSMHYALPKSAWAKFSPWLMSIIYLNYLWFLG